MHWTSFHFFSSHAIQNQVNKQTLFCDCRVKAVDSFTMEDYCVMVTASNDGFIKMWKLHLKEAHLMLFMSVRV